MAGGGRELAGQLRALDDARFLLALVLVVLLCAVLVGGRASWPAGHRYRYLLPALLFVAGSVVDAALSPTNTLVGPALLAVGCAVTAAHRDEELAMYLLATAFGVLTAATLMDSGALPVPDDSGGVVRAAGVGLVLATAGGLSALRSAAAVRRTRSP